MTQEEIQEQAKSYIIDNLNSKKALEVIKEILQNIENEMIEEGYIKESNRLVSAEIIINEVIQND